MSAVSHSAQTWAPHPDAAPATSHSSAGYGIAANGTRTLSGGWQIACEEIEGGATYRIAVDIRIEGEIHWRDALQCKAIWGAIAADSAHCQQPWDYLVPEHLGGNALRFARVLRAPDDARAVSADHGCGAHSEALPVPADGPAGELPTVYDDGELEEVTVSRAAGSVEPAIADEGYGHS